MRNSRVPLDGQSARWAGKDLGELLEDDPRLLLWVVQPRAPRGQVDGAPGWNCLWTVGSVLQVRQDHAAEEDLRCLPRMVKVAFAAGVGRPRLVLRRHADRQVGVIRVRGTATGRPALIMAQTVPSRAEL